VADHLIRIPGTRYYYVNNIIDLVMFNCFGPKPPQAEGDMQTDDNAARPEEYRMKQIASVDEDKEDEAEKDKEDNEEDNSEEYEKVQSPQGIRCSIAPTLPRFMAPSV